MSKSFFKGLIMAIVAFVAATISDQLGAGVINWSYVAIAGVGIIVTYIGKNVVCQSISAKFSVDFRDLLSGLFLAIGATISSIAASVYTTNVIDWKALGIAVATTFVGYLAKTFAQGSQASTTAVN